MKNEKMKKKTRKNARALTVMMQKIKYDFNAYFKFFLGLSCLGVVNATAPRWSLEGGDLM